MGLYPGGLTPVKNIRFKFGGLITGWALYQGGLIPRWAYKRVGLYHGGLITGILHTLHII